MAAPSGSGAPHNFHSSLMAPGPPPPGPPGGLVSAPYRPLNVRDALSYLDEVKVQFMSSPEVYNRFLDIMKDFKTQTIDTPGVIDRVSSLFRLHPALIQGFNTFLPPGYRIDFYCPYGSDPVQGTIYVTTPQGTTASKPGQGTNLTGRFPPGAAPATIVAPPTPLSAEAAKLAHQPVDTSKLPWPAMDPRPPLYKSYEDRLRKRLEDAAGNKIIDIVTQYSRAPGSFDAFALIKPLTYGAPDIHDELKDMIARMTPPKPARRAPSSSSQKQGRAPPPMPSNEEPPHKKKRTQQVATPPMSMPMPYGQPVPIGPPPPQMQQQRPAAQIHHHHGHHRSKQERQAVPQQQESAMRYDQATLTARNFGFTAVQGMNVVIPPPQQTSIKPKAESGELAFFDRISRYIDDRPTYHEFLKLCNLFTQDIIDLPTLIERAYLFLSGSTELWKQFRDYVGWRDDRDETRKIDAEGVWQLENIPIRRKVEAQRETYGPSYRKLPESERLLACSGRDQLCWDVLNDVWVSAPTWTSEEGFQATKKSNYEEALQRSEEDRFEYDYHIDAVQRTIATLEPVAARIAAMDPEERTNFRLKPGLGQASKSIYPTVLKKIYGSDIGLEIITALHENPCVAVPIVLARIKQKEEEWRRALRDWKPVWRDIEAKNHYKALDYQGSTIKSNDKKLLMSKSLVAEIETIRREQQQHALSRQIAGGRADDATTGARHQLAYPMPDQAVLFDALRLVLTYLDRSQSYSEKERDEIEKLLREVVQQVFAISPSVLDDALQPMPEPTPLVEDEAISDGVMTDADTAASSAPESTTRSGRSRRTRDKNALLKQAIDRTQRRRGGVVNKAGSPAPPSSIGDDEMIMPVNEVPSTEVNPASGDTDERPVPADPGGLDAMEGVETVAAAAVIDPASPAISASEVDDKLDDDGLLEPLQETLVPLERRLTVFCGSPLYSILRVLQILHGRLLAVKRASPEIRTSPAKYSVSKVTDGDMTPYEICLDHCQKFLIGETDALAFEDAIRATAGTAGYHLFTVDKVAHSLLRMLQNFIDPSGGAEEERAENIMELLAIHRNKGSTVHSELAYRASVEGALGALGENVYRIEYIRSIDMLVFQLLGKDELDEDDEETAFNRWEQYIVSFADQSRTEGFEGAVLQPPILRRHLQLAQTLSLNGVRASSGLGLKFCLRSLKIFYESGSEDWLVRARGVVDDAAIKQKRATRFRAWLEKAITAEARSRQLSHASYRASLSAVCELPVATLSPPWHSTRLIAISGCGSTTSSRRASRLVSHSLQLRTASLHRAPSLHDTMSEQAGEKRSIDAVGDVETGERAAPAETEAAGNDESFTQDDLREIDSKNIISDVGRNGRSVRSTRAKVDYAKLAALDDEEDEEDDGEAQIGEEPEAEPKDDDEEGDEGEQEDEEENEQVAQNAEAAAEAPLAGEDKPVAQE